jgi:hypothetical protein
MDDTKLKRAIALLAEAVEDEHEARTLTINVNLADETTREEITLRRLVMAIEVGRFDDDLEAILAACHGRKDKLRTGRSRRRPW